MANEMAFYQICQQPRFEKWEVGAHQKLRRVRNEGKEGDTQEFLIDIHTLEHSVDSVHQDLGDQRVC
jgi:hypothetical protein